MLSVQRNTITPQSATLSPLYKLRALQTVNTQNKCQMRTYDICTCLQTLYTLQTCHTVHVLLYYVLYKPEHSKSEYRNFSGEAKTLYEARTQHLRLNHGTAFWLGFRAVASAGPYASHLHLAPDR